MQSVVTDLDGVVSAKANYRKGTAVVVYEPAKVTPDQIAEQINTQTYYRARVASEFVKTARFKVPDLDTQEEANEIGRALEDVEGIAGGSASIGGLSVDYDAREVTPEQVAEIINGQTSLTASIDTSADDFAFDAVSTATAIIRVEGMTDNQTASQATSALLLDGIVDGSVDTDDATLTVVYDAAKLTAERIVDALRQAVPNDVSIVSVSEPSAGGGLFTSAWFVLSLVGLAVFAVFAWPVLKRRLQPASDGDKGTLGLRAGRSRSRRRRRS